MLDLLDVAVDVRFDQCRYGLVPPHLTLEDKQLIRKRTRLRTNMSSLSDLEGFCTGGHDHFVCLGSVRVGERRVSVARAAGRYPAALCHAWARCVARQLRADARVARAEARPRC